MEVDPEILEAFIEEMVSLKADLSEAVESLKENNNQPEQFTKYAQVIDRIYGTALTLGFDKVGQYTGILRDICRKTGSSKIPRAYQPVAKMLIRSMDYYDKLIQSLNDPTALDKIRHELEFETKKAQKLDNDIFAFSKDAKTTIVK